MSKIIHLGAQENKWSKSFSHQASWRKQVILINESFLELVSRRVDLRGRLCTESYSFEMRQNKAIGRGCLYYNTCLSVSCC